MGEGECEPVEHSKKGRHRKKQLYNSILQQMEFYFSDSNLTKDRFLSQLISQDPFVDLNVFLSFNKIRKLNCSPDDIRKAISKSDLIQLSEDREKICRKTPVAAKQNVDGCTIYVENIKADANHETLSQVFSDFGNVVYVSIPKYKQTKGNKGFAFIEFESEKEAEHALDYFESIDCKMPSDTTPEELQSIKTFEEESVPHEKTQTEVKSETETDCKSVSRINTIADKGNSEVIPDHGNAEQSDRTKKRKLSEDNKDVKKLKLDVSAESEEKKDQPECNDPESSENKKKKKHKKDKKKQLRDLGLRVLSKKEWKKMRNRYLDLQRKKMKAFKQYLNKQKFAERNCDKSKALKEENTSTHKEAEQENEVSLKIDFVPGVIVKLRLPEPCNDGKKFKNDLKNTFLDVQYVDMPLQVGSEEMLIRFSNADSANEFCKHEFPGEKAVLEGDEESAYWEKIKMDRSAKLEKSTKKQRGRDKLLKKAAKERAKHIRFDEGDGIAAGLIK